MSYFAAPFLLAGLAAVSIPVIIHLLNRRRFEVVDWGAMQFLQVSETVRRRLLLEDLLLLALRMMLIAVLVLGMATPLLPGSFWAWLGQYVPVAATQQAISRPNRDLVLIFDGSARMSYTETGRTTADAARDWAVGFMGQMASGDSVAILQAREKPLVLIGEPTLDHGRVKEQLMKMPPSSGGCNWPEAVDAALKIVESGKHSHRDIFLIGDGSRQGLADDPSLLAWKFQLVPRMKNLRDAAPRLIYVNAAPDRAADPPNWSVLPLHASRAVAAQGRAITFRTGFELSGQSTYDPPARLRLEIDGEPIKPDAKAPAAARLDKGKVTFDLDHRFAGPGAHLVSLVVEPDPPGQNIKDKVPADNRQDLAIEVVSALPVLLVDGDPRDSSSGEGRFRGAEFLQAALAPPNDPTPVIALRMVGISQFDREPQLLTQDVSKEPGSKPRVLILANVIRLTTEQKEAINRFLEDGGGVLVAAGNRADPRFYNEQLYRGGDGWLPARLDEVVNNQADPSLFASPMASSFSHPAVDLFKQWLEGPKKIDVLTSVTFPRWWKLTTGRGKAAVPIVLLTDTDPLLIEKSFGKGRVILSAVPLDNTWGTNLTDTDKAGALVPLAHELVYYLAGARSAEFNLSKPGQPILYRPRGGKPAGEVFIYPPFGDPQPLRVDEKTGVAIFEGTRQSGVYRVEDGGRPSFYVVQPDHAAALALADDIDKAGLKALKPLKLSFENDPAQLALPASDQPTQLWWVLLIGVVVLLCGEVWMTRRIALAR